MMRRERMRRSRSIPKVGRARRLHNRMVSARGVRRTGRWGIQRRWWGISETGTSKSPITLMVERLKSVHVVRYDICVFFCSILRIRSER
jgi:hypothetical protein